MESGIFRSQTSLKELDSERCQLHTKMCEASVSIQVWWWWWSIQERIKDVIRVSATYEEIKILHINLRTHNKGLKLVNVGWPGASPRELAAQFHLPGRKTWMSSCEKSLVPETECSGLCWKACSSPLRAYPAYF